MQLSEYQEAAKATAIYSRKYRLLYPALGLAEEAGEVAGKVKRMVRDDEGDLTPERAAQILEEAGDCLWYIAAICTDLGVSLDVIARQNIAKLKDRQARKKLKGEGDKR